MSNPRAKQIDLWGNVIEKAPAAAKKNGQKPKAVKQADLLPDNLAKAVRLPVPDFSNPGRKPTCLEADFPIAQINALSNLEGNAGKPIYQMSKWWARRRSSVFRSMLIAASTEAPDDPNEAAKRVWDHYYCNHQKAGSFKHLKVLDPFMGGGTTLVEGSRLGMQMTGIDLNPVAWFVVKNELACSDPEQVRLLFEEIERQVKPQIQPFYTTTCPRGHQGRWIKEGGTGVSPVENHGQDAHTTSSNEVMPQDFDSINLHPDERKKFRWEGPEVIYTFWAKHGPCQAKGCGHRTPIFRTPVIAEKKLSTGYAELTCTGCGADFHAELGETRMAPGAERVIVEGDFPFTELSQGFARLLNDYDKGTANDTWERALALKEAASKEPGLHCPHCGAFAGKRLADIFDRHAQPSLRATGRKKKDFALKNKPVQMYLLIHPEWLKGGTGFQPVNNHGQDAHATQQLIIRQGAYLPHWTKSGSIYSVTFRLADALPKPVVDEWLTERKKIVETAEQMQRPFSEDEQKRLKYLFSEKIEKYMDAGHGNCWMKQDHIAKVVADALQYFNGKRYELFVWSVMPNHVHVVVKPSQGYSLPDILHSWKSFTATKINKILGKNGEFWQPEYYDHLIRDEQDFYHSIQYVLDNPKKAGLKNWRWKGGTGFQPVKNHGQDGHATSELGGWAGAPAEATAAWFDKRMENLRVIEVRGKSLPETVVLADGTEIETGQGTVPRRAHFTCASCGREGNVMESIRPTDHTASVAAYALQCHCPQCDAEGYTYGGRYFKAPDEYDIKRLEESEKEWVRRAESDLTEYWPRISTNPYPDGVSDNDSRVQNMDRWNYNFWWKMFNSRQLLVHTQLLKAITEASEEQWPLDVREQTLGAFQQYLRNQNMFCFWDVSRDCMAPHMSNANYHPKSLVIENCVFNSLGRGNWQSSNANAVSGVEWAKNPWECLLLPESEKTKSQRLELGDPLIPGNEPYCGSSTDLSKWLGHPAQESRAGSPCHLFDLVITDPPFGNNLFYADLADFFYVWLRIPLRKWYAGLPEAGYFESDRAHRSLEAVDNKAEHPDDREDYEKEPFIESKYLTRIRELTGDDALAEKDPNPLYQPQPSSDFYRQTLSAVWAEAGRHLKSGGIMAFTFHHSMDSAWNDVLKALFDAGYVLIATYPIRSDESKGESAQFGSKTIEYDIIHVCRKRLDAPEPVSWARMRRWVKEETVRLKELLEHTHGKTLPESDLRVILRGKSLEFYSRHYGQVFTGDGQGLDVRDALLGINQLLDDLLEDASRTGGQRPPDSAEPASRLYLRLFKNRTEMERDELHKTLRGTGFSQGDLEARGWIRVVGRAVHGVPVSERMAYFTEPGRNRKVIKTDLDQAHFLIAAAYPNSGLKIESELSNPNFKIKKSVDDILKWVAEADTDAANRMAARTAAQLVARWRTRKDRPEQVQLTLFETLDTQ